MPRFYFDVREGPAFIDDEDGIEFMTLDEAEQEAIQKDCVPRGDTRDVTVEVKTKIKSGC